MTQAGITSAVAWRFVQEKVPQVVPATSYPRLVAYSAAAERSAAFKALPYRE